MAVLLGKSTSLSIRFIVSIFIKLTESKKKLANAHYRDQSRQTENNEIHCKIGHVNFGCPAIVT